MPMDLQTDRVPETMPGFEPAPPAAVMSLPDSEPFDLHREINQRRAQIENPEMLRRLRSL
jgi:hypothetical protein